MAIKREKRYLKIRDKRLYRKTDGTFEEYCRDKWEMSRPRAYQMIEAAQVKDNLSTIVDKPQPTSEGQTRPLTRLKDPELQQEAWNKAVESAPEGKVTGRHVSKVVHEIKVTVYI